MAIQVIRRNSPRSTAEREGQFRNTAIWQYSNLAHKKKQSTVNSRQSTVHRKNRLQGPSHEADSLLSLEYGIQAFEKLPNLVLQMGSDLRQPEEKFLKLLPIEFKSVSLPE